MLYTAQFDPCLLWGYDEVCRAWENVDWSTIDPDVSTKDFEAIRKNIIEIPPFLPN